MENKKQIQDIFTAYNSTYLEYKRSQDLDKQKMLSEKSVRTRDLKHTVKHLRKALMSIFEYEVELAFQLDELRKEANNAVFQGEWSKLAKTPTVENSQLNQEQIDSLHTPQDSRGLLKKAFPGLKFNHPEFEKVVAENIKDSKENYCKASTHPEANSEILGDVYTNALRTIKFFR